MTSSLAQAKHQKRIASVKEADDFDLTDGVLAEDQVKMCDETMPNPGRMKQDYNEPKKQGEPVTAENDLEWFNLSSDVISYLVSEFNLDLAQWDELGDKEKQGYLDKYKQKGRIASTKKTADDMRVNVGDPVVDKESSDVSGTVKDMGGWGYEIEFNDGTSLILTRNEFNQRFQKQASVKKTAMDVEQLDKMSQEIYGKPYEYLDQDEMNDLENKLKTASLKKKASYSIGDKLIDGNGETFIITSFEDGGRVLGTIDGEETEFKENDLKRREDAGELKRIASIKKKAGLDDRLETEIAEMFGQDFMQYLTGGFPFSDYFEPSDPDIQKVIKLLSRYPDFEGSKELKDSLIKFTNGDMTATASVKTAAQKFKGKATMSDGTVYEGEMTWEDEQKKENVKTASLKKKAEETFKKGDNVTYTGDDGNKKYGIVVQSSNSTSTVEVDDGEHRTEVVSNYRLTKLASSKEAVAPEGWEDTVKKMKDNKDIDNPWALSWWMKNKGYKPHSADIEETAYMADAIKEQTAMKENEYASAPVVGHLFRSSAKPGTLQVGDRVKSKIGEEGVVRSEEINGMVDVEFENMSGRATGTDEPVKVSDLTKIDIYGQDTSEASIKLAGRVKVKGRWFSTQPDPDGSSYHIFTMDGKTYTLDVEDKVYSDDTGDVDREPVEDISTDFTEASLQHTAISIEYNGKRYPGKKVGEMPDGYIAFMDDDGNQLATTIPEAGEEATAVFNAAGDLVGSALHFAVKKIKADKENPQVGEKYVDSMGNEWEIKSVDKNLIHLISVSDKEEIDVDWATFWNEPFEPVGIEATADDAHEQKEQEQIKDMKENLETVDETMTEMFSEDQKEIEAGEVKKDGEVYKTDNGKKIEVFDLVVNGPGYDTFNGFIEGIALEYGITDLTDNDKQELKKLFKKWKNFDGGDY